MMELGEKRYPSYEFNNQVLSVTLSIPLNFAEVCERMSPTEQANFYSMARGSTAECASWAWPST